MIRTATLQDATSICEIYNHYVLHSHSTFELEEIKPFEMAERMERVLQELQLPWLVIEDNKQVVGYAYATIWKPREAYRRTVESTVYLRHNVFGKGYGKKLYSELLGELRQKEYHAIIGGIALPNDASIALHESLGFEKIGQFKDVGYKFNRWIDVGYWELILKNS